MKKSGVILILLVISVLLISVISSISFVSANLLSDIWSKITGKAIEENATVEPVEEKITVECKDSDDGKNYYTKGTVTFSEGTLTDICVGDKLTERICDERNIAEDEYYTCPYGCRDGACLKESVPEPVPKPPEEVKPEPEPIPVQICAAKIKITFNKEIYYYGDYIEVVIEVFDSQENHLPYYPLYSQIYNYHDNMWHTLSEDKTDENGYKIFKGIVEEGKMTLGKTKQRVYTKAYANCGSVEESVVVEIRKGEKEEVCGIGVCVPEPEPAKEPEEIPKEKMLYSCSGCELESKCYPIGYREAGQYCNPDYKFINQIEEGKCENNFECKSNVCISDECVSEGLIKKIIAWFKRLFGKEEPEEPEPTQPKAKMCSDWLIEKDIWDFEFNQSAYGNVPNAQAPLYSEKGERIGAVKCCVAQYINKGRNEIAAMVCPYDSREELYNSLKWLLARGELTLGEYKGQKVYSVYGAGNVKVWTHKEFIIAVGADPKTSIPFSEEIANAYLEKYPNDLEVIETPETQPYVKPDEEFLKEIEKLGEVTLIDFETLPDGTILQNKDRLTGKEWESLGVVFEFPSENYLQVFGPQYPFNPLDKLSLSPGLGPFEAGGDTHDDLNIIFTKPVKAAGLYLLDLGGTDERESITFFDKNNNIIKKISPWPKSTFGNPAPGTFVYLIEDGISKIEILENTQDGDDIAYDNLYFIK